ncbi:hypothetical protein D9M68_230100 [compost metagenome]
MKRIFPALALALAATLPAHAEPRWDAAQLDALADHPSWIALGHYETGKLGGWRSYVDDDEFFLAADGDSNPRAELAATLAALYQPASLADRHPQCIYPARTRWLRDQLQLGDLPQPDCTEFAAWFRDVAPHSTVLVFPAAYLNSPSSMFGHTLLRIDQADVD